MDPEFAFSIVLKRYRTKKEMAQKELAVLAGKTRNAIGFLERGDRSPTLRTIFDLARALDVSPSELFHEVDKLVQLDPSKPEIG